VKIKARKIRVVEINRRRRREGAEEGSKKKK